ncbi:hypothetical protein J6590_000804, partial [Homalodisca vitripennis]
KRVEVLYSKEEEVYAIIEFLTKCLNVRFCRGDISALHWSPQSQERRNPQSLCGSCPETIGWKGCALPRNIVEI